MQREVGGGGQEGGRELESFVRGIKIEPSVKTARLCPFTLAAWRETLPFEREQARVALPLERIAWKAVIYRGTYRPKSLLRWQTRSTSLGPA